ncbi:hypothetical protein [Ruegeria atlantica]|uniref:hypothetical protein n=1 Tax=Ruegeria atlantica TaxID=81569 RepID=UPI0014808803|nr:hypothetical protein [Ruegeria atlantica]
MNRILLSSVGILATQTISACSSKTDRPLVSQNVADETLSRATLEYTGVFILPATSGVSSADNLEFYWSPTCLFSAEMFATRISVLSSDSSIRAKTNFGFFQVSRSDADTGYYAVMKSYQQYPDLCFDVLKENASRGSPMGVGEISRLASRRGYSRISGFSIEDAVKAAKVTTNLYVEKVPLRITPTTRLNGNLVSIT